MGRIDSDETRQMYFKNNFCHALLRISPAGACRMLHSAYGTNQYIVFYSFRSSYQRNSLWDFLSILYASGVLHPIGSRLTANIRYMVLSEMIRRRYLNTDVPAESVPTGVKSDIDSEQALQLYPNKGLSSVIKIPSCTHMVVTSNLLY